MPNEKKDETGETLTTNEIAEQASLKHKDEIKRQILRGDESKGDPDERDIAGAPEPNETPHGREEAKNDKAGVANVNG
jgi:hypothetical protein